MKLTISKATLIKILKLLKWGKVTAKIAVIGTTITGAATALSGSASTGVALSAAGATAYAATTGLPKPRYEKTKHIPPGRVDKAANMLRKQEIESLTYGKGRNSGKPGKPMPTSVLSTKQPARGAMASFTMPRKK